MPDLDPLEMVEAHQPREPACVHSYDYGGAVEHSMSWCSTCKDSPVLAEWKRYWNEEGMQFLPPGWLIQDLNRPD
jgi:hypothetical protein